MAVAAAEQQILHENTTPERFGISDDDRLLTEVDHLLVARTAPYVYDQAVEADVVQNLFTAVQEQAMPAAVTETRHEAIDDPERKGRIFMWMGRTAVENAMTGYMYHRHDAARKRVGVEVDEARHAATMTTDKVRVFISPRMTRADAPLAVARAEHVGDDDAVRVSWLETDSGKTERVMQSLLVKYVPFEAWVAMLEDEGNLFGGAVSLEDRQSALSVMKAHRQLELPKSVLPRGPVSIVEAVIPYIQDAELRRKVSAQARNYVQKDQEQLRRDAEAKADEWLEFEKELTESLVVEKATDTIRRFVDDMHANWSPAALEVIRKHTFGSELAMTRQLAAVLESAEQKLLSGRAAVLADAEFVLRQVGSMEQLQRMQDTERLIMLSRQSGFDYQTMLMQQNRLFASHNIKSGGGGCPGENRTQFGAGEATALLEAIANPFSEYKKEKDVEESDSDEFGSLTFECTEGHTNRRPRGELITECRVKTCKGTVGC